MNVSASTIQYQITALPTPGLFQFTYELIGFSFMAGQQLDISFNPGLYGSLSDPVAGSGFTGVMVLQPNDPSTGVPGDYLATALVNNPSLSGTFSVDFTYLNGSTSIGSQNSSQPYTVYDFSDGVNVAASGQTIQDQTGTVPEPASLSITAVGLLLIGACSFLRRRLRGAA